MNPVASLNICFAILVDLILFGSSLITKGISFDDFRGES